MKKPLHAKTGEQNNLLHKIMEQIPRLIMLSNEHDTTDAEKDGR